MCIFILFSVIYFFKNSKNNTINIEDFEIIFNKNNIRDQNSINKIVKFIINNRHHVYSSLASLQLAKIYVDNNMLNNALLILKNNLLYTSDINIFNITILNISKIQFQLNLKKQAIKNINRITENTWKNVVDNFKKNIFITSENQQNIFEFQKDNLFEINNILLNKNFKHKPK
ncbi:MAG: tetratricopeptide repeat protein [Buchnera aphidicola (Schlechtendalia peitan)]